MKIFDFFKKEKADVNGFIANSCLIISSALLNASEFMSITHQQISMTLVGGFLVCSATAIPTFIASLDRPVTFLKTTFSEGADWRTVSSVVIVMGLICDPLKDLFTASPTFNSAPAVILQSVGIALATKAQFKDE